MLNFYIVLLSEFLHLFVFWLLPIYCYFWWRTDARTMSSGSSAWEGQLTSLVLSEYASTEMSIHALYMHEVNLRVYVWEMNIWQILSLLDIIQLCSVISSLFISWSSINSSLGVICPVTRGTGRRVTKAATASRTKSGANQTVTQVSHAHTLSPQWFPVLVPFPRHPQPPVVATREQSPIAAVSGATVDLPQVSDFASLNFF